MNCPKCGREMEKGFLQPNGTSHSIVWVPDLLPFGTGSLKWAAQTVSYPIGVGNNALPAHICKTCKTIVADYSGKE